MSLKLLILGLLMEREMHPYEIRQLVKERRLLDFIKVRDGSLYYAVDQLKKDGCIDVVGVVKESNRPDRTIYRITEQGRKLFQELLMQQFAQNKVIEHPLYSALPFARYGDQARLAELIERKLERAEEQTARMRTVYDEHVGTVPKSVLHLMAGCYMHAKTEARWLRRLLRDAKEGRLGVKGESWDLDADDE
ncbi:PadR family transcriptional regulator [Gordoniibacillus kamchatkensis]|uniref:PadR family transcriptional regulator n=1 Tax=Gordoniibacillus kamchatkensis TaxID=1590651 RepID=A0ABR5ALJ6_9BACL|nr:PadR family transcriptional regulator [Paenibacillus sp. VKM B-2647]KIL41909.1 PadR family transcriptional regulator [Paenibacillus sp. VKM B-2647]